MPATPYIIEEYVRWSDVDFAGIIFYGSYVRFFEIAETELFRACGLAYARVFDRYDIFLPRKAVHSEFYWPARLDDRLRVATYVGRVGTKSMTLNFDVLRDGPPALGAAGWMVLVCVDRKRLRPEPLPAELAHALPLSVRARPGPRPPRHEPHVHAILTRQGKDTVRIDAPLRAFRCSGSHAQSRGGVLLQGVNGGNGVVVWLRTADSLTIGAWPLLQRGDT